MDAQNPILPPPYDELSEKNKEIIVKHLKIAGGIKRWLSIEKHLHQEFLVKKTNRDGDKPFFSDPVSEQYYQKYVSKCEDTYYMFFYTFVTNLTKVFLQELEHCGDKKELYNDELDADIVYYGHDEKPQHIRFDSFEKSDWQLDKCTHMTRMDVDAMERYKKGLLAHMQVCMDAIKAFDGDLYDCKEKMSRIEKNMTVV
jgi:hypothetical protein